MLLRPASSLALALILTAPTAHAAGGREKPGPDPAEEQLRQTLSEILRAPELGDAIVGVHVRSLNDGRTVFEKNSSKLFNPASNVKLITTAAALWYLGPSYKFKTEIYRDRSMRGGVVEGNLYVKGGGDPTLTESELFGLANEIALSGITEVKGNLVVDATFFDDVYEGPGWDQERSDKSYAPPIGGFSANYGTFTLKVVAGDGVGSPARVLVWPDVPSIEVESEVSTRGEETRPRLWVGTSKNADKLKVTVRGVIGRGDPEGAIFYRRVQHPVIYAGETFKRILELRGIPVKGSVKLATVPRTNVTWVAIHSSRPLAEVISQLNKYSNNLIAEHILKTLAAERIGAPGSWEKGVAVLSDFLGEIGVAPGSYVLGNGSGLNDINRMTPEQITQLLNVMYKRFEVGSEYVSSLAVAGISGTITSRMAKGPAEHRLRAKTGSLQGVSALSGYVVTRDDNIFAFSVMMNDYPGRARAMWRVQDQIGNALAGFSHAGLIARP